MFSLLDLYSQYIVSAEYLNTRSKNTSADWAQNIEEKENTFEDITAVYIYNSDLVNSFFFQKSEKFLKIRVANIRTVAICSLDNIANRYILTDQKKRSQFYICFDLFWPNTVEQIDSWIFTVDYITHLCCLTINNTILSLALFSNKY